MVLAAGATLDAPRMMPCGARPLAVVLDVDETALQNLGYEYDEARNRRSYDQARWNRWEQTGANAVLPMPGAVAALQTIRNARRDRDLQFEPAGRQCRPDAGGDRRRRPRPGRARRDALFLQGDIASGSAKDPRRAAISERYCVIAMAGDQLGDFSDLFNARTLGVPDRRRYATTAPFAALWGSGWFMLSNPVYGPSLRGTFRRHFPGRRAGDPGRAAPDGIAGSEPSRLWFIGLYPRRAGLVSLPRRRTDGLPRAAPGARRSSPSRSRRAGAGAATLARCCARRCVPGSS